MRSTASSACYPIRVRGSVGRSMGCRSSAPSTISKPLSRISTGATAGTTASRCARQLAAPGPGGLFIVDNGEFLRSGENGDPSERYPELTLRPVLREGPDPARIESIIIGEDPQAGEHTSETQPPY